MTKKKYDRARVMRDAHNEWRGTKHKPGMTFGKCLALAWKVEKQRCAGPQYYQLPDAYIISAGSPLMRDIIRL